MFDLQYTNSLDTYQYELYMMELYEEEAFSMGETQETIDEMLSESEDLETIPKEETIKATCTHVLLSYMSRAKDDQHQETIMERAKAVEFIACKASLTSTGEPYMLTAIVKSKNSDGHDIHTRITERHHICSCDNAKYTKTACKHQAALAARWLNLQDKKEAV